MAGGGGGIDEMEIKKKQHYIFQLKDSGMATLKKGRKHRVWARSQGRRSKPRGVVGCPQTRLLLLNNDRLRWINSPVPLLWHLQSARPTADSTEEGNKGTRRKYRRF